MARAETVTLLPLDSYARLMKISPPHFNQLEGTQAPMVGGCDDLWDQDAREFLAWTMAEAEEMIATELGFWESPKFITDEDLPFGIMGIRRDWRFAEQRTIWSQIECFGTEILTLKQADAGVKYEDLDNDPLERKETATIGTAIYADLPACDNPCEVAVFFRVADGAEDAADPRWEIKPIKVDIDGATMRITAESSLFAVPQLWLLTEADCAGSDDKNKWRWLFQEANLVPAVDVYCRTINKATPVTVKWDGICDCTGVCQHKTQLACAYKTDLKRGFFVPRPATWNGTTNIEAIPTHIVPPESVIVNYRAGYPLNALNCRMNPQLERAIVKLTNVLLPEPPCGFCDAAQTLWKRDREKVDDLTLEAANLPWDLYSKGALEAWRIVKKFSRGRGAKVGRGYR